MRPAAALRRGVGMGEQMDIYTTSNEPESTARSDGGSARRRRRMTGLLLGVLAVVVGVASTASAHGGRPQEFAGIGGYVMLGAGGASESFDIYRGRIDAGSAVVVGGRLGYRAAPFIAVEGSVDYMPLGIRTEVPVTGGLADLETKALLGTANLKLYPGDWRVQPYALAGVGALYATNTCKLNGVALDCLTAGISDDETAFAGKFGGGLDVYLSPHVALNGELAYVMPTQDLSGFRYLSYTASLVFRF